MNCGGVFRRLGVFAGYNRWHLVSTAGGVMDLHLLHTSLFRQTSDKKDTGAVRLTVAENDTQKAPEREKNILCRACRQMITSPAERIEMQGAHRHTFANPHGLVFEIGCFRFAAGCGYTGPVTDEFSWFGGYAWRIAMCRFCLNHIGWLFTSPDKTSFNGLILDRLVFPENDV